MKFATRKQGQGMARLTWVCSGCRASYTQERPKRCSRCGVSGMHLFDSQKELRRFAELILLERAKMIANLEIHPRFALSVRAPDGSLVDIGAYEADFAYIERGQRAIEDVKPRDTRSHDPLFVWKRKHFEAQYGVELRIVV